MNSYVHYKRLSTMMILQAWKTVQPHRPLIRFRNGPVAVESMRPSASSPSAPAASVAPVVAASPPTASRRASVQRGPVLEEWQVPERYRRLPIEQKEMDAINMGGSV